MADYELRTGGVYHRPTMTFIPENPRLRLWQKYLSWLAVPNTPDPDPLGPHRTLAKLRIDEGADLRRHVYLPIDGSNAAFWWHRRYDEAVGADADGTPTAAEWPLMDAEIPHTGADIEAVADAVLAEYATAQAEVARVRKVQLQAHADIDAAGSVAAIEAVADDVEWPNDIRADPVAVRLVVTRPNVTRNARPDPLPIRIVLPVPTVTVN